MNPDNSNLQAEQIAALKNQCFTLLLALILVSATLTAYLYREARVTKSDLTQAREIEALVTQNESSIGSFVNQLVAYGQTHPDFRQAVLQKYGLVPPPGTPVPAPKK